MNIIKKISAILFYITIVVELIVNLLIIGAFLYSGIMVAYIYIYSIVLIGWLISSIVFAIMGKWGKALLTSFIMAIVLIGCGYAQPNITFDDYNTKNTLFFIYHIHILVPSVFAFIVWLINKKIKKIED